MAKFRHTISLVAVPQQWFARAVRAAHDAAPSLITGVDTSPRPGDRLVNGDDTLQLAIKEWRPQTESSGELTLTSDDDDTEFVCKFVIRSVSVPATVELDGVARLGSEVPSLFRGMTWTLRADLRKWWAGEGPITADLQNSLGKAAVTLVPGEFTGGEWRMTVQSMVRGRWLLRPIAAVALLVMRGRIDKQIGEFLHEQVERRWNAEGPALLRQDPAAIIKDAVAGR